MNVEPLHPCDGFGPGGLCAECCGEAEIDVDRIMDRIVSDLRFLREEMKRLQKCRAEELRSAGRAEASPPEALIQGLIDAVDHLEICSTCAEDNLTSCVMGGRDAVAAREAAREYLRAALGGRAAAREDKASE